MKKENKTTDGIIKTDIEKAQKRSTAFHFPRTFKGKVLSIFTAISLTLSATLGLAACDFTNQTTPVDPDKPNPIQPVDPEKPAPEKPDPEKPDPEKPDPEKPDPEKPDPVIDYDKLTPETLTAEQKATMVNNVTTALEKNIKRNIGNSGVVNKVIALDFDENYVTLLLDYDGITGNTFGLFKYTMSSEVSYKTMLVNEISPISANGRGEALIQFSSKTSDERTEDAFAKLQADGAVEYDKDITPNFVATAKNGGGVVEIGGVTGIDLIRIDSNKILSCHVSVKSDGNTTDFIGDNLLNGTLNKTYLLGDLFEYDFSDKAIYNYNGLEKETTETKNTTAYNFIVDNQKSQYIKNGKYLIIEEENQN